MAVHDPDSGVMSAPDDFPVAWEDEAEQRLYFRHARDHFPTPIAPLDFAYFKLVLEHGVGATSEHYEGPVVGWHLRRFNTFFYQSMVPFRGEPEVVAARAARSEEKILADIGRLEQRWMGEILPEILEHLAWWDGFDLEAASDAELLEHFRETWARGRRMWELHFMAIVPAYIALSEFEELYRDLLGDSGLEAFTLLGGAETKNVEIGSELWRLSRSALRDDAVRAAIETANGGDLEATLEATDAGRAWLAELRDFLARYGERGDTWVLSAPSWIEDASMVVKNIRDLLALPDADAPGIATQRAAQERDLLTAQVRERLQGYPALAVEQFESLLAAARVAAVIQDDHNFFIDFCSSYRVRRVILECGRRLVRQGSIEAVADVFMLLAEEIEAGLDQSGDVLAQVAAARRAEMEEWSRREPPANLGTRPTLLPDDNPVFRFMQKFYGIPPAPSGDPGVVSGLSGSGGRVRGTAKVLMSIAEMDKLQAGDVLIAETTAPPWTPLFATAAAVVTDSGGILSHCAVVAREYGIPAVVGTGLATRTIKDGQTVEVDGDAGVVRIIEEDDMESSGDGTMSKAEEGRAVAGPTNGHAAIPVGDDLDPVAFLRDFSLRNADVIPDREQGLINSLRVLCGGCGSVGGSVVEPLVRLGVGELILADPDGYELNNLNRQVATYSDLGRAKVDVLAERATSINPNIRVTKLPDGLTPENVEAAVNGASVVFDGVDPSPGPLWMKYLLHFYAARHRVPVVAGADLGGQPTLYVFDYRQDPRPFYGKANVGAFREGRLFEALVPWMGLQNVPSDFLPIILSRATTPPPADGDRRLMEQLGWPQVSYCAAALGAIGTRTIVDVAQGRRVPHLVAADLHMLTRPRGERIGAKLRRPIVLAKTVQTMRAAAKAAGSARAAMPRAAPKAVSAAPAVLAAAEAIRLAPSAHNTQPWRLTAGGDRIAIGYDPTRHLDVGDPTGRHLCHSLGCAIEAAATVAEVTWQPSGGTDPLDPEWIAGHLAVDGLRADGVQQGMGLLGRRGTNRGPYATRPLTRSVLAEFDAVAARHGVRLFSIAKPVTIGRFAEMAGLGAGGHLLDRAYLDELLQWTRFSEKDLDHDEDGFTADMLGLDAASTALMRQMKRRPGVRRTAARMKLPALMGKLSAGPVRQSAAVLLVTTTSRSPEAYIDAGRAMMGMWLAATREGLAMQPVGWPLDVDELRPMVSALFKASRADEPVLVLRVGRTLTPTPPSPRLPLSRILYHEEGR